MTDRPPDNASDRPTLILMARHGLTPSTGKVLPGRTPGLHLSEKGLAQAEQLAERFRGLAVDALYTSPLERTRETAEPIAKATGLDAEVESDLLECDFGEWTGEKLKHVAKLPEWGTVQNTPSVFRFPDGESFAEMQYRMIEGTQRIRDRHPGQTVVCFSHADPIKALLNHALGSHLDHFQRISVDPCSVSAISYLPGQAPSVLRLNTTDGFLADLLSA